METVITPKMKIKEVEGILDMHRIPHPTGWELVMCMLMNGCKYIRVVGCGKNATFCREEVNT